MILSWVADWNEIAFKMHQQLSAQINQVLLEVPALIRCTPAQGTCSAGMGETAKNSGKRKGIWKKLLRKQGLELDSEGQEAQEKEYL